MPPKEDIGFEFIIFTAVILVNTNLSEYYLAAKHYLSRFCSIFFNNLRTLGAIGWSNAERRDLDRFSFAERCVVLNFIAFRSK